MQRFQPVQGRATCRQRTFAVGFMGRLAEEKSPGLFVTMAALVAARVPEARFVVIGGGPLRVHLEKLGREKGLGSGEESGMHSQRVLVLLTHSCPHAAGQVGSAHSFVSLLLWRMHVLISTAKMCCVSQGLYTTMRYQQRWPS